MFKSESLKWNIHKLIYTNRSIFSQSCTLLRYATHAQSILDLVGKCKGKAPLGNSPPSPAAQDLCRYHCAEQGKSWHLRAVQPEEDKVFLPKVFSVA